MAAGAVPSRSFEWGQIIPKVLEQGTSPDRSIYQPYPERFAFAVIVSADVKRLNNCSASLGGGGGVLYNTHPLHPL